jgi:hypothetical protein
VKNPLPLLICAAIAAIVFCGRHGQTDRFSEYLKAAKDIRTRLDDPQVLEDSLRTQREKYGIDLEREFSRLRDDPSEWIPLLRTLKRG